MLIDHELYSVRDINAYFSETWVSYEGRNYLVLEANSDREVLLSCIDTDRTIWVEFDALEVVVPPVGLFQFKRSLLRYSLEPYRQWKKSFRLSKGLLVYIRNDDLLDVRSVTLEKALIESRTYSYKEAYDKVNSLGYPCHMVDREWFLGKADSPDSVFIELFHASDPECAVGIALEDKVVMYFKRFKPALGVEVRYAC